MRKVPQPPQMARAHPSASCAVPTRVLLSSQELIRASEARFSRFRAICDSQEAAARDGQKSCAQADFGPKKKWGIHQESCCGGARSAISRGVSIFGSAELNMRSRVHSRPKNVIFGVNSTFTAHFCPDKSQIPLAGTRARSVRWIRYRSPALASLPALVGTEKHLIAPFSSEMTVPKMEGMHGIAHS